MSRGPLRWLAGGLAIAAIAGLVTLLISGGGEGGVESTTTAPSADQPFRVHNYASPATGEGPGQKREIERVAKSYIAAIDDRDGQRVCSLYIAGALGRLELPRDRGNCAASVSASIGYRDPRGFPVWERTRIARVKQIKLYGDVARVTMTIVTQFADQREPSIEDDLIYLVRKGDRWLIFKPDVSIYRAIGAPEPPPQAITPP